MTFGLNLFAQKAKEDKKYKHKKQEGNSIQLIVGEFTQRLTTKAFDYAQFFYHGDKMWTVITYGVDNKVGLKLKRGKLLEDLLALGGKQINVFENKITKETEATNLRIKTMSTMVVNDDSALLAGLASGQADVHNKTVKVYDARTGSIRSYYSDPIDLEEAPTYMDAVINNFKPYLSEDEPKERYVEIIHNNLRHRDDYVYHEYLKGNLG